jgi:hypothetical protein
MGSQDAQPTSVLILTLAGAATWGVCAWVDTSGDWRSVGPAVVFGVFLGLLFAFVLRKKQS